MRAPDQIDKQHPETDLMTQAFIRGAEGYRVAVPLMEAWDNLPRSVQVAICMEFADLRSPDAHPAPMDREALVELIRQVHHIDRDHSEMPALYRAIADALLARSLRLPGPETMAWAVVGEDGKIDPRRLWINSRDAEEYCERGERAVRVAIRVVEGGDDAA